jgi:hypothetical protein
MANPRTARSLVSAYPSAKLLSRGANNLVYAFSDEKVGKRFELGSPTIREEFSHFQAANAINSLVVQAFGIERPFPYGDSLFDEYLVMERLYPLQYRAIDLSARRLFLQEFRRQLAELHASGVAHYDIKRPIQVDKSQRWDNIVVTEEGIRLIDMGVAILRDSDTSGEWDRAVAHDLASLEEWTEVFLAF